VPQAYTRVSPFVFAWSIALPTVAYGAKRVPVPVVSLPVGATKTPKASLRMHGSAVSEGSSLFARQSPLQTWNPVVQLTPHAGVVPVQVACPLPDGGATHALVHEPQWLGSVGAKHESPHTWVVAPVHVTVHAPPPSAPSVQIALPVPAVGPAHALVQLPQCSASDGSTHAPAQFSEVAPLHPRPHMPPPSASKVHVACPAPASGPTQTFSQLPQCAGCVGSTHEPLQSSEVGAVQE
jgi:hypothetical protein